jgi:hypothetical protein
MMRSSQRGGAVPSLLCFLLGTVAPAGLVTWLIVFH